MSAEMQTDAFLVDSLCTQAGIKEGANIHLFKIA